MKFNKSVDFFIQAAMKLLSCMCFTLTMFLIIYGLIFKATDTYLVYVINSHLGMSVVGKGSWKEREIESFKFEILKLESFAEVGKS